MLCCFRKFSNLRLVCNVPKILHILYKVVYVRKFVPATGTIYLSCNILLQVYWSN